jgi:hypothetical protein
MSCDHLVASEDGCKDETRCGNHGAAFCTSLD